MVSKAVIKFRYGGGLRNLKYGHTESGINICFINNNNYINTNTASNMHAS